MAEDLQEVTNVIIDTNEATPRLEHIKLPNGVSYKIGLSLEEQKSVIYLQKTKFHLHHMNHLKKQ